MPTTTTTTSTSDQLLIDALQKAFPDVDNNSFERVGDAISQASAEGLRLSVKVGKKDKDIFVKRVDAPTYSHKSWAALRRTLLYLRTEVRFYNDTLPLLEAKGLSGIAPRCYHASYDLNGLISESDRTTDVSHDNPDGDGILEGKGGALVLDCMSEDEYFQDSPLKPPQVKQCLAAAARLHAAAWEDEPLLAAASDGLSRGAYNLQMRDPKELQGLVAGWDNFCNNFRDQAPELFERESVQRLGQRVYDLAETISKAVSPEPADPYATLAHGDYKAMNVFIPKDDGKDAVMIDYASTGVGLGMSDVAYHVYHALWPEEIDEEDLLDSYLNALQTYRVQTNPKAEPYSRDVAFRHFRYAVVDYFRFFLGRFWCTASVESLANKKDAINVNLINREVGPAMAFVATVDKFLTQIEKELEQGINATGAH